jgi:hypothetical protein
LAQIQESLASSLELSMGGSGFKVNISSKTMELNAKIVLEKSNPTQNEEEKSAPMVNYVLKYHLMRQKTLEDI